MINAKEQTIEYLNCEDGSRLAYQRLRGRSPGVVFLGGFMSDMSGTKASYLAAQFENLGQSFLRFDYFGHGKSSGLFEEGTIGRWKQDAIRVLDDLTEGPQILVGSSMGGWIMALLARERKEQIAGLVGISSAPDFTENLIEHLSPLQRSELENQGLCRFPSEFPDKPYVITKRLIEDGKEQQVLGSSIPINCSVRLLHGTLDKDVSWQSSLKLLDCLQSEDARLTLIKNADHRLSAENNLDLILSSILELIK